MTETVPPVVTENVAATARGRRRPVLWLAIAIIGSSLLKWSYRPASFSIAPVDLILVVLVLIGGIWMTHGPSLAATLARRSFVWLWLIACGSIAALFHVGFPTWALTTIALDFVAFAVFFTCLRIAEPAGYELSQLRLAFIVAIGIIGVAIIASGSAGRADGTFDNPNYAGHYLATATVLLVATQRRNRLLISLLLLAAALVLIGMTGSFGSIAMVLTGLTYYWRSVFSKTREPLLRLLHIVTVAALGLSLVAAIQSSASDPEELSSQGLSSARFERSSSGRISIWTDALALVPEHPFGVGPHAVPELSLVGRNVEVHNDYIAYLVERGVIGLIGMLGFFSVLWRASPRLGAARAIILAAGVGALFRETLHFRHLWLALAVALVFDWHRSSAGQADRRGRRVASASLEDAQ